MAKPSWDHLKKVQLYNGVEQVKIELLAVVVSVQPVSESVNEQVSHFIGRGRDFCFVRD